MFTSGYQQLSQIKGLNHLKPSFTSGLVARIATEITQSVDWMEYFPLKPLCHCPAISVVISKQEIVPVSVVVSLILSLVSYPEAPQCLPWSTCRMAATWSPEGEIIRIASYTRNNIIEKSCVWNMYYACSNGSITYQSSHTIHSCKSIHIQNWVLCFQGYGHMTT